MSLPTTASISSSSSGGGGSGGSGGGVFIGGVPKQKEGSSWSIETYARIRPPVTSSSVAKDSSRSNSSSDRDGSSGNASSNSQHLGGGGGGINNNIVAHKIKSTSIVGTGFKRDILELMIPADSDPGLVHNNSDSGILKYEFNKVFTSSSSQAELFDAIAKDKMEELLDGVNCTIFAYGQTGSGKTYSIGGGDSFQDRGLIPRCIGYIFQQIKKRQDLSKNMTYKCRVSYTEVYMETIYDLLDQQKKFIPLEQWSSVQIFEGENGLILRNLNEFEVTNEEDALGLFFLGTSNRLTSSTTMNQKSSRSHAIFTIAVEGEGMIDDKTIFTNGKINLVDLAGSERMYKSNYSKSESQGGGGSNNSIRVNSHQQMKEAKSINLSLHYLEQVIICLRDQNSKKDSTKPGHVPYRNSVLTSLLRDSLGGNCRSCFLLNMSSELDHFEESVTTCRFGQRCGEVKVNVYANTEIGLGDQLNELNRRIKMLQKQLNDLDERKLKVEEDLKREKQENLRLIEIRKLTEKEVGVCNDCIRRFVTISQESANNAYNPNVIVENEAQQKLSDNHLVVLEQARNSLLPTLETLERSPLLEVCMALSEIVQSKITDISQIRQGEFMRERARKSIRMDREAKAQLERAMEEERRLREIEEKRNQSLSRTLGLDISDEVLRELIKGSAFVKQTRFGSSNVRYVSLTKDLLHICWRKIGNMASQKQLPLADFDSVEFLDELNSSNTSESCIVVLNVCKLPSNGYSKTLTFEFGCFETLDDNRAWADRWIDAVKKCIARAKAQK